jgi:hypothetical protein
LQSVLGPEHSAVDTFALKRICLPDAVSTAIGPAHRLRASPGHRSAAPGRPSLSGSPDAATHWPVVGLHVCPAGQLGVPAHVPALHVSFAVQAIPSLQGAVLFGCVHTPPSQTSVVHWFASSAHGAVFAGCAQTPPLHTSSVHGLPSSLHPPACAGCVHTPPLHTSAVHTLPSSVHGKVLLACWQAPALHVSVVHGLSSLHCASPEQPDATTVYTSIALSEGLLTRRMKPNCKVPSATFTSADRTTAFALAPAAATWSKFV